MPGMREGRAEAQALCDHPQLKGWRVYLCGHPGMVQTAKRKAYLAGASLTDIYADPFVLSAG
jgi:NAD(P)H-flavin reductase